MAFDRDELTAWVLDARERTLALAEGLTDAQWLGPRLAIVNPMRWELGHVGWFQERWVLRHAAGHAPLRADGDALYDSASVPHRVRWDLPLPDRAATLAYVQAVADRVCARIQAPDFAERDAYFVRLAVFHEDMHDEAFVATRQALGYPAPAAVGGAATAEAAVARGPDAAGDAAVPGGTFRVGAEPGEGFVFDNEKWAHDVTVEPFAIARAAVTQGEFAAFVDDDGYRRRALWSDEGWAWRVDADAG